ncbi:hypothetical protein BH09PSE3_BH09PSE3_16890 [soil metagenome]
MLTDELGPAVFNRPPSRDDGRPVGLIRLFLRPAGLFVIALLAMLAVLSIKLWREGVFESFRVSHAPTVQTGDKSWMLGDRLPPPSPEKPDAAVGQKIEPPVVHSEPAGDDSEAADEAAE